MEMKNLTLKVNENVTFKTYALQLKPELEENAQI